MAAAQRRPPSRTEPGYVGPLADDDLRDADVELRRLESLADLLDSRFRIPGTDIRFGIDPLVGLLPGIGDSFTLFATLYMIARARRLGVPGGVLMRMAANGALDWVVGSVPVLGDLFDVAFKAHRRNLGLIRRHLATRR